MLLDEPTSQLDPVAGDELIWLLRRLNEEWGTAVVLAEHRLERCLAAADRVVALARRRVACDAPPREFLGWAADARARAADARRAAVRARRAAPAAGRRQGGARDAARPRAAARRRARRAGRARRGAAPAPRRRAARRRGRGRPRSRFRGVWHELRGGPAILRGVDLDGRARASASR